MILRFATLRRQRRYDGSIDDTVASRLMLVLRPPQVRKKRTNFIKKGSQKNENLENNYGDFDLQRLQVEKISRMSQKIINSTLKQKSIEGKMGVSTAAASRIFEKNT